MEVLTGKTVVGGIAQAKILVIANRPEIAKQQIENINTEFARLESALQILKAEMQNEVQAADTKSKDVLNAQLLMLEDDSFVKEVKKNIETQKICAEYASVMAGETLADEFRNMDNSYMQARSEDMEQIASRLVDKLLGYSNKLVITEPVILMAEEFTPAQLAALDKNYVRGLVAHKGNASSHTAILAANYGLPYIFDVEPRKAYNGKQAVLDADSAHLAVEPNEEVLAWAKDQIDAQSEVFVQNNATTKMKVYANISSAEEVEEALANNADGIGLFRTEFLFMNRNSAPTEEEQYEIYKTVLEGMGEKPVIIRTIDIGTDKPAPYLNLPKEENPALGMRGVRVSLADKELFNVQLKALLRASVYGNAYVMFPMITSVEEIEKIQEHVMLAVGELEAAKLDYKLPKFGIMVETPAAAVWSEELAKHVDFFSIGTNDLTQYTLALDRQAQGLEAYYNPHHEAVLRLIEMTIVGGHKAGIPVGICGQLGGDVAVIPRLVKAGLDEVSVAIASIPKVRHAILEAEGSAQTTMASNSFTYTITDPIGIHARPAGEIARIVKGLDCKVEIHCGEKAAEAKSVIKLMKLGAKKGSVLEVNAEGKDAGKALQLLKEYMTEHL